MPETLDNMDTLDLEGVLPVPKQYGAYAPKKLFEKHHEILRLCHMGLTDTEISKELGVSIRQVKYIHCSELGQAKMAELSDNGDEEARSVSQRIAEMQPAALNVLEDIISEEGLGAVASVSLKQKTAGEVLRMGGNGPITKVDSRHSIGYLEEPEALRLLKTRATEIALETGNLVELEVLPETGTVPVSNPVSNPGTVDNLEGEGNDSH